MVTISVVISAYNEEAKLPRTLASLTWADEIIVIDNESSDLTSVIARKNGAKVYRQKNNVMLNINKNYGFSKATSDWILCLDADEEVPKELAREIRQTIAKKSEIVGYWIARKNIIFGKWIEHGLWWPDRQLRLFQKGTGKFPCIHVHEYIDVHGPTGELQNPYIHHNYETISQFITKMDTIYTENEVQQLKDSHYQIAWYDAFRFPLSDFVKIYFAQRGYKDGLHGLVISILQSFYSFVVFAKLWEQHTFPERTITLGSVQKELDRSGRELSYWSITAQMKQCDSPLKRLWFKILRRLATGKIV